MHNKVKYEFARTIGWFLAQMIYDLDSRDCVYILGHPQKLMTILVTPKIL